MTIALVVNVTVARYTGHITNTSPTIRTDFMNNATFTEETDIMKNSTSTVTLTTSDHTTPTVTMGVMVRSKIDMNTRGNASSTVGRSITSNPLSSSRDMDSMEMAVTTMGTGPLDNHLSNKDRSDMNNIMSTIHWFPGLPQGRSRHLATESGNQPTSTIGTEPLGNQLFNKDRRSMNNTTSTIGTDPVKRSLPTKYIDSVANSMSTICKNTRDTVTPTMDTGSMDTTTAMEQVEKSTMDAAESMKIATSTPGGMYLTDNPTSTLDIDFIVNATSTIGIDVLDNSSDTLGMMNTDINTFTIAQLSVRSAEAFLAFCGNFLTLFSLVMNPNLRTPSNLFIGNLAFWDFISSFTTIFYGVTFSQRNTEYYAAFCQAQVSFNCLFFIGNIYGIMLIALDRFLMVQFPAWYRNNFNYKTATALLLIVNIVVHTGHLTLVFQGNSPSNEMPCGLIAIIGDLYLYVVIPEFLIVSILSVLAYARVLHYLYTGHQQTTSPSEAKQAAAAEMGQAATSQSEAKQAAPAEIGQAATSQSEAQQAAPEMGQAATLQSEAQQAASAEMGQASSTSQSEAQQASPADVGQASTSQSEAQQAAAADMGQAATLQSEAQQAAPAEMGQATTSQSEAQQAAPAEMGQAATSQSEAQQAAATKMGQAATSQSEAQQAAAAEMGQADTLQAAPAEMGQAATSQSEAQQVAATKMVSIILGIYFACYVPLMISIPILLKYPTPWAAKAFYMSQWVALINSWVNPMIYAWRSVQFKDAFTKLLTCKW